MSDKYTIRPPSEIIKLDRYSKKIHPPRILLMTRGFRVIGKISKFTNWHISLIGSGLNEVTFDVNKYVDGKKIKNWDDIVDLKVIDVGGYGRFEINVQYTDEAETIKSIHGISLESELCSLYLNDFHVNDEETIELAATGFNNIDWDYNENKFIPTVFYNPNDPMHSLLNRVISEKAPHWKIGYVTPFICIADDEDSEPSDKFQRTYTEDGVSIYDFLTGTVSDESNVIFVFDTINRIINCYSMIDCIDQKTGEVLVSGIGEDTTIFVSKNKLADEISINYDKDSVINCFRVKGGDDVINDMVRAVNVNGSNYIIQFADFQYDDMSESLCKKLFEYQKLLESKTDEYYSTGDKNGENKGIYVRLCDAYDRLYELESGMMPSTGEPSVALDAKSQYEYMLKELQNSTVSVSALNSYNNNLFQGVTNNVESMAAIYVDSRFDVKVITNTTSYNSSTHKWRGKLQVIRNTDDTDIYPVNINLSSYVTVNINDNELEFAEQKILKSLYKGDMLEVQYDISKFQNSDGSMNVEKLRQYFDQYSLNRLSSFYDGYNSCVSILMQLGQKDETSDEKKFYNRYKLVCDVLQEVLDKRQSEVDDANAEINKILVEQSEFQKEINFQSYLGNDYDEFCTYRREDTYQNDNYISDGLSTSECIQKAKELISIAKREIKKSCVLQRTVSCQLSNLLALPEFEPIYNSFSLFNYIRVKTDDEILKLRILQVDFDGESVEDIDVTFSDQITSVDKVISDLQSMKKQADGIAASYSSTTLQAKHGYDANKSINDIYQNGLNASQIMLANNDNNEVTTTGAGMICKRMDDEGMYGNRQTRVTGNGIYMTDDAWQTVSLALGEVSINDEIYYGLIADAIVGNLIFGKRITISNESGNMKFDKDGFSVTNGTNTVIANPNNESIFTIKKDSDNLLNFDSSGNLKVSGYITATNLTANKSGSIAGWNIAASGLKYGKDDDFILLDPAHKSIISEHGNNKVVLTSGYLGFEYNNNKYATFSTTYWGSKPDVYGVSVFSEVESKFIAFGNKSDITDKSYKTVLLLNYGLDPDGYTDEIRMYGNVRTEGSQLITGHLYFKSKDSNVPYIGLSSDDKFLFCSGAFCVGGVGYKNMAFSVTGDQYNDGSLTVINGVYAPGIYNATNSSASNLVIGNDSQIKRSTASSKRFKHDIKPIESISLNPHKLYDINVVQYKFNEDYLANDDQRYGQEVIGFIAEDIFEKYPIAVDYLIDENGNKVINDWNFRYIIPAMLKLIQEQKLELDALKKIYCGK